MTKLRIMSDLHLEFSPLDLEPIGEDILVLAGDIGICMDGADWALKYARRTSVHVVMIAGNHEFYRNSHRPSHTMRRTIDLLRDISRGFPKLLTFLEDDIATVCGVTFVGCTLWTDFDLFANAPLSMLSANRYMNDYCTIWYDERERFTVERSREIHDFSAGLLRERLPRRYDDGTPLVVVTHHLPSARSLDGRYADEQLSAAYASNLDELVEASGAALWVHGHTHVSKDYTIGHTRVLCNPRGYVAHEVNPSFDSDIIVEV